MERKRSGEKIKSEQATQSEGMDSKERVWAVLFQKKNVKPLFNPSFQ
jgi:hypothetical protein